MSQPARAYPRSQPHVPPPQELAARETRLWRWMLLLIGSAVVTVMVLIAGAVVLLNRPGRRAEPAKPHSPPPRTWVRDLTPALALDANTPRADPGSPPRPEPTPEPAKPAERLLEALGGLTAAHLYQTYLNIGLLADSAESEVYTAAEAKKLLETLMALLATVDRLLGKVEEQGIKPDDQKSLERTRRLVGLLRTQGVELNAYWDTGDKEHTMKFHKAREEAWIGIRELLGLPE